MAYDRHSAVDYAHQWAYSRNPKYYSFDALGGDCTSFISQCLHSGCGIMNHAPTMGWYYSSLNSRSPAWSGVEFLYRFLTTNKNAGPYATELPLSYAQPGDIIQLSFDGVAYKHSLFVVDIGKDGILIATHSDDSDNRPLNTYQYQKCRLLHIEDARS